MSGTPTDIRIRYRRPAHEVDEFVQRLVARTASYVVTLHEAAPLDSPRTIDGSVVLEPGAPVVWFSFRDAWHDIGRFHDAAGSFTGIYANILTPVHGLDGTRWSTTDLCLDVWLPAAAAAPRILDADELVAAVAAGHIGATLAARAQLEAETLLRLAAEDAWPPRVVDDWTLARARAASA